MSTLPRRHSDVDDDAPTILNPRIGSSEAGGEGAIQAELSRYVLGDKLGAGGMAAVFRATDKITGETVALKIIENGDEDASRTARFEREVRAAGGLVHENVCRVLSFGRAPQKLFMAMELVEGATLQRMIKARGTLPVPLALEALRQLLLALDCAHKKGVVHRDLKPANVMVTPGGTLKLLDFGIAKSQEDATVTATGLLIGTPAFMAPEQILGAGADARSDLFSAGVTFFVALTGRTRFHGHDPAAVMVKVSSEPVPSLLEECPVASNAVDRLLARLCAQNVTDRFQTAADALAELSALEELPTAAEGKRLLARYLADPDEVALELAAGSAAAEKARATRLLKMGPAAHPAAALALHRASLLAPEDTAVRAELRRVCDAANLTFDPGDDPRVAEAQAAFEKTPNAAGVLKRLADLHKARGNVLLAAAFLTRYLRVKPTDSVAAQQLSVLLDGPAPSARGDAGAPGTGERLRTRDIVAGIKTGGQIAPVGGRPRPDASSTATVVLPTQERAPLMTSLGRAPQPTPQFAGPQGVVATPAVIVAGGGADRVRASIHPLYLVIGAVVVAGIVIALFGRFVRTTVDDVQLAISDNSAKVAAAEQNSVDRMREGHLTLARGQLDRGNYAAAAHEVNLLLATRPPAEMALEGMLIRARARLRLNDKGSARFDLEEYLKQSPLTDPHRTEVKALLDGIYAERAATIPDPAVAPRAAPGGALPPEPRPEGLF